MTLYLVGTPLGNLGDMTPRAVETLRSAPVFLVEKWEDSVKLLKHFEIYPGKILKYDDANSRRMIPQILDMLASQDVALITSAGMPGVSDPGAALVTACHAAGITVIPIPGPSALTTAIAASGFRGEFLFVGFFPKKDGERKRLFERSVREQSNLCGFESPYRLLKTLALLAAVYPTTPVFIGKEMTKKFERFVVKTAPQFLELIAQDKQFLKGEFTLVVGFGL